MEKKSSNHAQTGFPVKDFPPCSGVYLFKDASGRVIYVGKAKSLKKRLASYMRPADVQDPKTRVMLARATDVDYLCTATEKEALLLEAGLIKKHKPRYNVVLKDDKSYVLFKLDKASDYPRLSLTRRVVKDGSVYYGPFTSALAARETWKAVGKAFPLRKCKDSVFKNRVRPCLYHHIGQCLAPCVKQVSKKEYAALVRRVEMFLSGRSGELVKQLEAEMAQAAEALEFERAAKLRDQVRAVRRTVEGQVAVLPDEKDRDVVGVSVSDKGLSLTVLFVRRGRLIDHMDFFWPGLGHEDAPEALRGFLTQFYGPTRFIPETILVPWPVKDPAIAQVLAERRAGPVRVKTGTQGREKKLLDLAARNARQAAIPQEKPLAQTLKAGLGLGVPPKRIEAVDVSHLGGEGARVGMVVFFDAGPDPGSYRIYKFPELEGTRDDYKALYLWARRRIESGPPWPDLLLIDGGRGQLSSVERGLAELNADGLFELAAIAKGGRNAGQIEDKIYRPGRKNPLPLKPGSPELLFLQRVRDAAHRFAVTRQRRVRKKKLVNSEITALPGIGPKTARLLWDRFGTLDGILAASVGEIESLPGVGKKRAEKISRALETLRE